MADALTSNVSVRSLLHGRRRDAVSAPLTTPLADIVALLARHRIGAIAITASDGTLVGILSERDVVRCLGEKGTGILETEAQQVMTRDVVTCTPDTCIEDVLALMSANGIRHVPVVDGGQLAGVISVRDILDTQRDMLLEANEVLEARVEERTLGLLHEIGKHKKTQRELDESNVELRRHVAELKDTKSRIEAQGARLVALSEDLVLTRDLLENADRTKTEFLSYLSHELRSPLNAVIGLAEIIAGEKLGPVDEKRYVGHAESIRESGAHLLSLVNDLLDIAKIESGTEELYEEEIEPIAAIESVARLVSAQPAAQGVSIVVGRADRAHLLVADARKFRQVLINLISNAAKFTEVGGRVEISAWGREDSGYVIQITDTGIGMAAEDIPKALSKFGQVSNGVTRERTGTGLGLPLSKSLVELHGGTLDLQSALGVGTTVTLRFPAARIRRRAPRSLPASTRDAARLTG